MTSEIRIGAFYWYKSFDFIYKNEIIAITSDNEEIIITNKYSNNKSDIIEYEAIKLSDLAWSVKIDKKTTFDPIIAKEWLDKLRGAENE